jgi:hypothetical protein
MNKKMFINEIIVENPILTKTIRLQLLVLFIVIIAGFLINKILILGESLKISTCALFLIILTLMVSFRYWLLWPIWLWKLRKNPIRLECIGRCANNGVFFKMPSGIELFVNSSIYKITERKTTWVVKNEVIPLFVIKKQDVPYEWMRIAMLGSGPPQPPTSQP